MADRKTYLRGMTPKQESHLQMIKHLFESHVDHKYRKGAKEHGGNLWQMKSEKLLDSAIDEAIDQVTYLFTLKAKLFLK